MSEADPVRQPPRVASERRHQQLGACRFSAALAATLLMGALLHAGAYWFAGRTGESIFLTFFFGPLFQILSGVSVGILLKLAGRKFVLWFSVIALSALSQTVFRPMSVRLYFTGFCDAVLAAGAPEEWENLPMPVREADGQFPGVLSADQLPPFVGKVYPGWQPIIAVTVGTQGHAALQVIWGDHAIAQVVVVGDQNGSYSDALCRRRLSSNVVAYAVSP